jgi:hypothetical protein
MNASKKIGTCACLLFFSASLVAQETKTIEGRTTGVSAKINFKAIALYELENPPPPLPKRAPNHAKKKPVIANPVDLSTVLPFTGKTTTVEIEKPVETTQRTLEAPCVKFSAMDADGTSNPPDVNGAVGFDFLMTTLNTQVRVQNKQGGVIWTVSLLGFWNGLGGHTDIFDPKISYDPYDKRWIFICCATRQAAGSALLVAVSETPDPSGGWTTYTIDADPANLYWFDYPSLGFNRNWIAVGGYMFDIPGMVNTQRSRVWVINKAAVYAGNPNIFVPFFDRTDYFHISPAVSYSASSNTIFCVSMHNGNFGGRGFVRLFSITGTGPAPVFNVHNTIDVGTGWSNTAVNGPQLNSATGLNLGDERILQVTSRNAFVWFSQSIFLPADAPTMCTSQIVALDPINGTTVENIRTGTSSNFMTAYPSVSVNQNNDVFFGYSAFSSGAYVRASVSFRRSGSGLGFQSYDIKNGEDWYVNLDPAGRNRWGDYSATYIDPEDDVTAWTIQEYARPRVFGASFWGTWWAKICPGSCTNDFALSATVTNVMRKYEANNTITSSALIQNNSSIKYDAGTRIRLLPGFKVTSGSKFNTYIEGCGGSR